VFIVSSGVGPITESDIELAFATKAQVFGFHVNLPKSIQKLADDQGVKVRTFKIIYELIENVQKQVLKLIEPTIDEEVTGEAQIKQIFEMKGETIAGCKVTKGEIKKTDLVHLKRNDQIVADPKIKSIQQGKAQVEKVKSPDECGIVFTRFSKLQVGDVIVAYVKKDE
jgi:translation initiation factor IF-2